MTPPVPAVRRLPPKVPTKTLVDSEDYATLCPVINDDDAPTTSGTGDSGYGGAEEWKQHMRYPPPFEGRNYIRLYLACINNHEHISVKKFSCDKFFFRQLGPITSSAFTSCKNKNFGPNLASETTSEQLIFWGPCPQTATSLCMLTHACTHHHGCTMKSKIAASSLGE